MIQCSIAQVPRAGPGVGWGGGVQLHANPGLHQLHGLQLMLPRVFVLFLCCAFLHCISNPFAVFHDKHKHTCAALLLFASTHNVLCLHLTSLHSWKVVLWICMGDVSVVWANYKSWATTVLPITPYVYIVNTMSVKGAASHHIWGASIPNRNEPIRVWIQNEPS